MQNRILPKHSQIQTRLIKKFDKRVQRSFSDEPAKCIESRAKLEALQEQKLYSSALSHHFYIIEYWIF
jgi:hypothetical protein